MITISLNNFKNVLTEKTYKFKRGDLFHLTGASGSGKSSLLEAFEWVIFGKMNGVKPRAHKDLLPKVELTMDEVNIIRDGNDLTVKTPKGKTLTSDAAQGYISTIFGDRDLWKCCSYLEQGNRNLLLTGTGEEKLRLLRELAYGVGMGQEDDPEYYLTVISESIKKCMKDKAFQSAVYDSFYAETERVIEKYNDSENSWDDEDMNIDSVKDDIKTVSKSYKDLCSKISEQQHLQKEKESLVKRLQKNKQDQIFDESLYENEKEYLNSKISDIKDKIKDLEFSSKIKQFLPYEYNSAEYESLRNQESDYKSWSSRLIRLNLDKNINLYDLKKTLAKIKEYQEWEEYISLKEKYDYLRELNGYFSELEDEERSQGKKILKLKDKLEGQNKGDLLFDKKRILQTISDFKKKKCFTCPSCKDSLFMDEKGSLSKADKVDIKKLEEDLSETEKHLNLYEELEKLERDIKEIVKDIEKTLDEIKDIEDTFPHEKYKDLSSEMKKKSAPEKVKKIDFKELEYLIETYVSPIDNSKLKLLQNGESLAKLLGSNFSKFQDNPDNFTGNSSDISTLEKESLNLKKKLDRLENEREDFIKTKKEEELLTKNLDLLEKRIDDTVVESDLQELEERLEDLRKLETDYIKFVDMEERMKTLTLHENKLNDINSRLQRLETLFELVKKISIEPIEILIETLNYYLNNYLDRMFNDNPIRVLLSLYKTSSGPKSSSFTKIAVNLQIYHGENSYPNINSLSGGESDRVSLALTLAMAKIVGTPLLFLDECMASLDSELREQCLSLIREIKCDDRIVIDVCHETVEGFHDKIVKIT